MGRLFNNWAKLVLVAAWVVLASGCATPAHTPAQAAPGQPPPQRQATTDKRFIVAPELKRLLQVVSVRLDNSAGNFLRIQVNVRNMTDAHLHFRYHIEWFDKDGQPLPLAGEAYIPWMLVAHEESSIAATSPTPTAVDFGIMFVPAVD